jgi:3-oxoacyl-[acyl-carrier-protein] synthase II
MNSNQRVVITGLGIVSPIGCNVPAFEANLKKGMISSGPLMRFQMEDFPVKKVFEIKDFIPPRSARLLDPFIQYALSSSDQALSDAKLDLKKWDPTEVGVVMSSSKGGFTTYCREMKNLTQDPSPLLAARIYSSFLPNMGARWIARQKKVEGPVVCYVTACATGTYSIAEAAEMIRRGEVKICIAGATDAGICDLLLAGYHQMGVHSNDALLPFDKKRSGFQLGEGAGCLILEPLEEALTRGASIYGEIGTHAYTSDAYSEIGFNMEGDSLAKTIRLNLSREGLKPEDISYINLHGTATREGDLYEIDQLRKVFGDHLKKIPMSATKSMTGHMLGASGAAEIIATLLAMKGDYLPPTAGTQDLDEPFQDLNFVLREAQAGKIKNALTYSLGFGGHIVSSILKKYEN